MNQSRGGCPTGCVAILVVAVALTLLFIVVFNMPLGQALNTIWYIGLGVVFLAVVLVVWQLLWGAGKGVVSIARWLDDKFEDDVPPVGSRDPSQPDDTRTGSTLNDLPEQAYVDADGVMRCRAHQQRVLMSQEAAWDVYLNIRESGLDADIRFDLECEFWHVESR